MLPVINTSSQLLGVTYSEFDNKVGPQLRFQYPEGILGPEVFETLSDYVIVGKHLCEKFIVLKTNNMHFLNYSIAIENSKVIYFMEEYFECITITT